LRLGPGGALPPCTLKASSSTPGGFLPASTAYEYRVIAVNSQGDSDPSNIATAITASVLTPPAAATALVASQVTTTTLTLSWTDNANNETGYRVERRLAGGTFAPVVTLAANATIFADTALAAGTAYEYRVFAFNSAGDSATSNVLAVTTQSASVVPLAPTNLAFVVQAGAKVQLT